MEYNETLYGKQYLLGTDVYEDGKHKILNVPLIDVMDRNGFIPEGKYNEIYNLSVVWYEVNEEILLKVFTITIVVKLIGQINQLMSGQIMMKNF